MTEQKTYETPLSTRYASPQMSHIFSPHFKHTTWRKLWVALAKAEKALGLPIAESQIHAMEAHTHKIDFAKATEYEKKFRHDVMAHIHAFGDACPEAKGIIHLGATSAFVTDNTDLIQMREGMEILKGKLVHVIRQLSSFASKHAGLSCLSYTHFQAAQPTTVGKRACLWLQDVMMDLSDLEDRIGDLRFLGVKGATGTQSSFLSLFKNDGQKVKKLDELVAKEMGFSHLLKISGQTYTRKQDMRLFSVLSGIGATAHKFATDIRLLSHIKEVEEPFTEQQVGSSAMPHKRNPMRCERICGLSRFLISLNENPCYTASTQWLERTLDDSANRRISLSEGFLCADAILDLLIDVTSGLVVYPKIIERHLKEELPFIAAENILMEAVQKGKDRQEVHEKLRQHSLAATAKMKEEGTPGDLLERIGKDAAFGLTAADIQNIIRSENFTGRAEEQVYEFLKEEVQPLLHKHKEIKPAIHSIHL